ncbi:hypothetical protein PCANC_01546 [Puccinia coronata f. sp. avenae]|uniref:Uncharacterized protein n=1 Tax=Puccinia coronata f. sp. avenae TaxID=200324 RepID=A0A2N5RZR6_9BASI|nr:hypothetical protein PCANC_26568 [Puccinia coronata f. sp. avenae]PLW33014.1 hypothetical protein PCASD_14911 [Puccinia coronata f. sp. avenae]PLW55743.1 hypothetical protein PCANC_01546 [Puccinia coronata f. sp. avenae]
MAMITVLFSTLISFTFQKDPPARLIKEWTYLNEGEEFPVLTQAQGWAEAQLINPQAPPEDYMFEFKLLDDSNLNLWVQKAQKKNNGGWSNQWSTVSGTQS